MDNSNIEEAIKLIRGSENLGKLPDEILSEIYDSKTKTWGEDRLVREFFIRANGKFYKSRRLASILNTTRSSVIAKGNKCGQNIRGTNKGGSTYWSHTKGDARDRSPKEQHNFILSALERQLEIGGLTIGKKGDNLLKRLDRSYENNDQMEIIDIFKDIFGPMKITKGVCKYIPGGGLSDCRNNSVKVGGKNNPYCPMHHIVCYQVPRR